ncbi:EVE domain-containing protein [Calothrix sp. 336/3]|uniref:EVE domain-containing protein n=1 Tax=Calothrix sp. 336/3 TaxID=1337936 RepID=UPI0004E32B58|nr:EVE domain-containing protein [Calothrix sp. 336/3]AKG24708.1 ubiquinol-cytochrome C reductase [Calothrix sp. 336/3]
MGYWLLKTEPDNYAYSDLEKDSITVWDGVSNALALKNIRSMVKGDLVMIYHTGKERRIMGIGEIMTQPYADPSLNDEKRAVVDVKAQHRVPQPVTLAQIKADSDFADFELLRLPRLSVVPMSESHWQKLLKLANYQSLVSGY